MNVNQYFRSLTLEIGALKNRVRQLVDEPHWQTDGEWKESVIRQILRRHLPASVTVGRGFVVTADTASHQLDVLLSDASKPVVFRDGDLAFVTPDAVIGAVEVKSSATPHVAREAARKLASDMALVRASGNSSAFAGFFAFDDRGGSSADYLNVVAEEAEQWENRVDFLCVGRSRFIRYWHLEPPAERFFYEGWRSYRLPARAPGYFIHNIIDAVSPASVFGNKSVWFPQGGKENFADGAIPGRWPSQRRDLFDGH